MCSFIFLYDIGLHKTDKRKHKAPVQHPYNAGPTLKDVGPTLHKYHRHISVLIYYDILWLHITDTIRGHYLQAHFCPYPQVNLLMVPPHTGPSTRLDLLQYREAAKSRQKQGNTCMPIYTNSID